jgi:putative membrane protein
VLRWLVVSWAANAVVLAIAAGLLSGVTFHGSFGALVLAAAVFGVLNTILKPILRLLTLPIAIITLGIAWFFVSLMMIWLTTLIVGKFDIDGFWNYVWATIIVWLANILVDAVLRPHAARDSDAPASAAA